MVSKRKPLKNKKRNNKAGFLETTVKVNQSEKLMDNVVTVKNKEIVNMENGVVAVVEKKDPRLLKGESVHISKGKINSTLGVVPIVVAKQENLHKISRRTAYKLFSKNRQFRKMITTDKYCYVGGRYILKTPKAFAVVEGRLIPNTSIPNFEKDYCLCIKRTVSRLKDNPDRVIVSVAYEHAAKYDEITKEDEKEFEQLMRIYLGNGSGGGGEHGTESFGKVLTRLMKNEHVSDLDMWERTGFSERQIRRFRNNEQEPKNLETVIVLCIALGLTTLTADLLINASGRILRKTKKETAYKFLLDKFSPRRDVVGANKFLISKGMKPLNKKLK